jgi:rhodanese-related sulfurtransferase
MDAAPDTRSAGDVAPPPSAEDAIGDATGPVAPDTNLRADAGAPDAGQPSGDAGERDSAPVRPDAVATDTAPVRADATAPDLAAPDLAAPDLAAPDLAVVRADGAGPEIQAPPDTANPADNAIPRSDTAVADTTGNAAETSPSGCAADGSTATLVHLTAAELKALLDRGEDPFLINVKGASIGLIPGTDAVLVNDIPGIEALVGGDHCANIILYCQSGNTSQSVGNQLIAKGYVHVRDLAGGITAWKDAGYPTE